MRNGKFWDHFWSHDIAMTVIFLFFYCFYNVQSLSKKVIKFHLDYLCGSDFIAH